MKKLFLSLFVGLLLVPFSIIAQTERDTFFPRTPEVIVYGYYHELSQKLNGVARSEHAGKVFSKYFSKEYVEWAGKDTKKQTFEPFKGFVQRVFSDLPNR